MTKTYYDKRVLLDYNIFLDQVGQECFLLCLDRAQVGIIQTLVTEYGLRSINWVKEYIDNQRYLEANAAEMAVVDNSIAGILGDIQMTCNFDDLATAIESIGQGLEAMALSQTNCCSGAGGGSGGAGDTAEEPSGSDTTGETPPPGFDTWAEYIAYKCGLIEWLVEQVKVDVGNVAGLSLIGLVLRGLSDLIGLTSLTPIPGDCLNGISGAFLTWTGGGSLWDAVEDIVTVEQDNIICSLYTANTSGEALTLVHDLIDAEASTGGYGSLLGPLAGTIAKCWYNQTAINMLFEKTDRVYEETPGYCFVCCEEFLATTVFNSRQSPSVPSAHWVYIVAPPGCCYKVTDESFVSYTPPGGTINAVDAWYCGNFGGPPDENWGTGDARTFDFSTTCFQHINIRGADPRSFEVVLVACP